MKTDARVRYTRKVIQDAFLDILKEKPISRITVKEVCDKAEINRGTFYKHYQDCYDLLDKIGEEGLRDGMREPPDEIAALIIDFCEGVTEKFAMREV